MYYKSTVMLKVAFSKTVSFSILANSFLNMNLIQDTSMLFATFVMIYWLLSFVFQGYSKLSFYTTATSSTLG